MFFLEKIFRFLVIIFVSVPLKRNPDKIVLLGVLCLISIQSIQSGQFMVVILDGNLGIGAHPRSNLCIWFTFKAFD